MSDKSVASALRSPARLVVVEAPAGCGKTFQGAEYAKDASSAVGDGRVLILTHTHAACDVFAARTQASARHVDIRTIDGLIAQIATVYHASLGLPADTATWARTQPDGFGKLAAKAAVLLRASPMIGRALASRFPIVICDEHQDASAEQHEVAMACHEAGALARVFCDPMQRIYGGRGRTRVAEDTQRWESLKQKAEVCAALDEPHRWSGGSEPLGRWILDARAALQSEGKIDLRNGLPQGVSVIYAENRSPRQRGGYMLENAEARPIRDLVSSSRSILVLATQNETVGALHAFFGRRLLIWEGHVRENLEVLVDAYRDHSEDAVAITKAVLEFVGQVATGFTPSVYGNALLDEVSHGCRRRRRGMPATLQQLGRLILEQPNHKGVSKVLRRLKELKESDSAFSGMKIDYYREFWDAIHLEKYDDPNEGLAEITLRRTYARLAPPEKGISTVHKAKGLEFGDVLVMPCDAQHFPDSWASRCRLYVAMSRAMKSLTFVASRTNPSPLLLL